MLEFLKSNKRQTRRIAFPLNQIQYICKKILPLDASKAHQTNDMATKVIKNNSRIFPKCFQANLNNTNETSAFLDHLKYVDFQKDSQIGKKNYGPVSILPNVSTIYQRCIKKYVEEHFQALLSKYQCGFRKSYSVIYVLLPMAEKLRKSLNEGGAFGPLLTDLSQNPRLFTS